MTAPKMRTDWVFLVVSVLKTKNTYRLRKFRPVLKPNEFCYAFKCEIDINEWLNRVQEVDLPRVTPPEIRQQPVQLMIAQSTPDQVMARLTGDETGDKTYEIYPSYGKKGKK